MCVASNIFSAANIYNWYCQILNFHWNLYCFAILIGELYHGKLSQINFFYHIMYFQHIELQGTQEVHSGVNCASEHNVIWFLYRYLTHTLSDDNRAWHITLQHVELKATWCNTWLVPCIMIRDRPFYLIADWSLWEWLLNGLIFPDTWLVQFLRYTFVLQCGQSQ